MAHSGLHVAHNERPGPDLGRRMLNAARLDVLGIFATENFLVFFSALGLNSLNS